MRAPDSRGSSCIFIPGFCQFRASWDTDLHRTWKIPGRFQQSLAGIQLSRLGHDKWRILVRIAL